MKPTEEDFNKFVKEQKAMISKYSLLQGLKPGTREDLLYSRIIRLIYLNYFTNIPIPTDTVSEPFTF